MGEETKEGEITEDRKPVKKKKKSKRVSRPRIKLRRKTPSKVKILTIGITKELKEKLRKLKKRFKINLSAVATDAIVAHMNLSPAERAKVTKNELARLNDGRFCHHTTYSIPRDVKRQMIKLERTEYVNWSYILRNRFLKLIEEKNGRSIETN